MSMEQSISYTTEDIAQLLKVSKLTVYDLIKKGEIRAYRVGRQMRIDAQDLEAYKERMKSGGTETIVQPEPSLEARHLQRQVIISGQDISLDLLSNTIEKKAIGFRPLRSYVGSLNSLMAMYQGEADIVSTHLYDGDTGEYNIPYIKRILVGHSYLVVNLLSRSAGFFVQQGNPKNLHTWSDLKNSNIRIVNREKGSGARVLIDEQLRLAGIPPQTITGYDQEETNHIAVASKVATGEVDVGVGIEKAARLVGVKFIPLIEERYDLVILKTRDNQPLREAILDILRSEEFQHEISSMGGYDLSQTGQVLYETY